MLTQHSQVVLAAAITTRSGKPIVARTFREIKRPRLEALLAALPRLADTQSQHTVSEPPYLRPI